MTNCPHSDSRVHNRMPPEPALLAFNRLHSSLQEALYRMRWTKLHPIQVDAIHEVFDGTGDLIIAARTAAGKTEAAFLPILSTMLEEPSAGIRAIYVGPLKALINDQFSRLEVLCQEAEIAVHKWHGDVSATPKRRMLDQPSGVLLITPESIESLFINHPHRLSQVFHSLAFIVIDELHSFIGTERGAHLRSLISRLATKSRKPVRRAGLSATLGPDIDKVRNWLRPDQPDAVRLIEDSEKKSIRLRILGYLEHRNPRQTTEEKDGDKKTDPFEGDLERDVFDTFHGQTALIFANSKSVLERCADFARREAARRELPDLFRVHHGSLSKSEREETEEALKSTQPTATFCSSTLEMGIDVGNVKLVGQIDPPWSVSSLTQRLGRSGRKEGESSVIRIYIAEDEPDQNASLFDRLFIDLLQATAMTELMLQKWCEPPEIDRLHLSTLIQQVLSVIAERGGSRADELYRTLILQGGFPNVNQPTLIRVLRSMGAADLIEQAPDGLINTGLRGEKILRNHDFYVAFIVHEEYRVSHAGHHVGNIAFLPEHEEGKFLILAGRRWQIFDIDHERKSITVRPSPGGRVPGFHGDRGVDIHPRVREMMKTLLTQPDLPGYLDMKAREMLLHARSTARDSGLLTNAFLQDGLDAIWFTWTGSRIQRTLSTLVGYFGGLTITDESIALVFEKTTVARVQEIYSGFLTDCPDAISLARKYPHRIREKYEIYLSDDLTAELFARERIDLKGAIAKVRELGE
jgi:ATP-dependent helicase Lhr and Lhr-like helicase